MMTCGLTVTRSAGRFCINRFFFTFEHMIGSVSVTCLTCSRMSALIHQRAHSSSVRTRSKPPNLFFFSRIRFSFRIFKMRGFVSPAVHHSNAYPAQSCKSATLTRVTTGSQHDFIMPWCKDDTIYQNSRLCIVKFSYSPSQEDTQQIIQLYLLGLKD